MNLINADSEKELREKLPEFVEAIEMAKKDKLDYFIFMLDAFAGEPELIYKVLWFAYSKAVPVLMIPAEKNA